MSKSKKRRPILMGTVEQVATATEGPCPTPLTQRILEQASVRPASARGLVSITPKCHRKAGMTVGYCWSDGCAVLTCSACGAGVARLLLAVDAPS